MIEYFEGFVSGFAVVMAIGFWRIYTERLEYLEEIIDYLTDEEQIDDSDN